MGAFENIEELERLSRECGEDKEFVWKSSDNNKVTPEESFSARSKFFCKYLRRIEGLAGDVLDLCKDLIDANKDMKFEEYYASSECIYMGSGEWRSTILLFVEDYNKLKKVEKDESEGKCRYYFEDDSPHPFSDFSELLYERKEKGKTERGIVNNREDYTLLREYASYKNTFEYKLCSRLSEYIYNKRGMSAVPMDLLQCLASTGCLYIALKNEKAKLRRQNSYFHDTKTQGAKASTKAKKTKQPREVFTERAKEYFAKAEEAGYLKKVGNKYEWLYRGGTVALVYFFIRIYEPKSPPFKQLQPLFGVEGLTSSRRNLEKTDWYKDEMKREAMTPEELVRERRERKLKEPKEWFPELKSFFED